MLTLAPQIKMHAKPVGRNGDQVTLKCFVVAYYPDGHAEVIKTFYETITESQTKDVQVENTILALPGAVLHTSYELVKSIFTYKIVSPYVKDLSFVVAQPIRGPSF